MCFSSITKIHKYQYGNNSNTDTLFFLNTYKDIISPYKDVISPCKDVMIPKMGVIIP